MGEGLAVRNEDRAQNWFQVIQECRDSGLTNREFCRQRGIPEKKFYYWLRKLRTQALEAAQPQIVPISPGAVAEEEGDVCMAKTGIITVQMSPFCSLKTPG